MARKQNNKDSPLFNCQGRYLYNYGVTSITFTTWERKPTFEIWAHIPRCGRTECPAWERCLNTDYIWCQHIKLYITRFLKRIESGFKDDPLNDTQLARLGSELIPLYCQLARVQIHEQNCDNIVLNEREGKRKPQVIWAFREVQSLIRQISTVWREIGVAVHAPSGMSGKKARVYSATGKTTEVTTPKNGNGADNDDEKPAGYYEGMEAEIEREKALIAERDKAKSSKLVKRKDEDNGETCQT